FDSLGLDGPDAGALRLLDADTLAGITTVFANNVALRRAHRHGCFAGDVLFFEATEGKPPEAAGQEAWAAHVAGRVHGHRVRTTHGAMTAPEPLAEIATVLAKHLAGE